MKPKQCVVFDFDGTLISKKYKSLFDVMDEALNESSRKEINRLREIYLPKIHSQQATLEEQKLLTFKPIEIWQENGLTMPRARELLSKVRVREGVLETMVFLQKLGLPMAVISYSFFQFIEIVLEANGLKNFVSEIYGPHLVIQGDQIVSYKPQTFVFAEKKGKLSFNFAIKNQIWIGHILAIGDSPTDHQLGCFKHNRLGLARDEEEKFSIQKHFGEVVITEDFWPVLDWLKKKTKTA